MFTGLVEEVGRIERVEPRGDSLRLHVRGPRVLEGVAHGASIAVSGVCLTVVASDGDTFETDVMGQTVAMSTAGEWEPGRAVNLERAMAADARLGGHIVQGHVDGVARLVEQEEEGAWRRLRFAVDREHAPLIVDKGSIAVDGTSLTVSAVSPAQAQEQWFEVSLIPETLRATTLGALRPGDSVNIETDIIARHVARMAAFGVAAPLAEALR